MTDFKIFEDEKLSKEVKDTIDLGKLEAGKTKKFEFYVFNTTVHPYENLGFTMNDPDIKILSFPSKLNEKSASLLVIEWTPSKTVEKGLKTKLEIKGFKVVG